MEYNTVESIKKEMIAMVGHKVSFMIGGLKKIGYAEMFYEEDYKFYLKIRLYRPIFDKGVRITEHSTWVSKFTGFGPGLHLEIHNPEEGEL